MQERGIDEKEAANLLYNSQLYSKLEDARTRAWRLAPITLYDLLEEEFQTGSIINWPMEQG